MSVDPLTVPAGGAVGHIAVSGGGTTAIATVTARLRRQTEPGGARFGGPYLDGEGARYVSCLRVVGHRRRPAHVHVGARRRSQLRLDARRAATTTGHPRCSPSPTAGVGARACSSLSYSGISTGRHACPSAGQLYECRCAFEDISVIRASRLRSPGSTRGILRRRLTDRDITVKLHHAYPLPSVQAASRPPTATARRPGRRFRSSWTPTGRAQGRRWHHHAIWFRRRRRTAPRPRRPADGPSWKPDLTFTVGTARTTAQTDVHGRATAQLFPPLARGRTPAPPATAGDRWYVRASTSFTFLVVNSPGRVSASALAADGTRLILSVEGTVGAWISAQRRRPLGAPARRIRGRAGWPLGVDRRENDRTGATYSFA